MYVYTLYIPPWRTEVNKVNKVNDTVTAGGIYSNLDGSCGFIDVITINSALSKSIIDYFGRISEP